MKKNETATKIEALEMEFREYRDMWSDCCDDRKVFCNVFDLLEEAIYDMEIVSNIYIRVAFNEKFSQDWNSLEKIVSRFTGKEPAFMR